MAQVVINSDDTAKLRLAIKESTTLAEGEKQTLVNKIERLEDRMVKWQNNKAIKI